MRSVDRDFRNGEEMNEQDFGKFSNCDLYDWIWERRK